MINNYQNILFKNLMDPLYLKNKYYTTLSSKYVIEILDQCKNLCKNLRHVVYSKSVSCSYISFCLTSTSILFCVVCKYRNKKYIYKSSFGTYFPISGYIRFCYLVTSLCNVKQYFSLEETLRLSLNFKYNFFGKCQLSQKY